MARTNINYRLSIWIYSWKSF